MKLFIPLTVFLILGCGGSDDPGSEQSDASASDCRVTACEIGFTCEPGNDGQYRCQERAALVGSGTPTTNTAPSMPMQTNQNSMPTTSTGAEDTDAACSDGMDNDGDPFVDCDDYDCSRNPDVTVCDGADSGGARPRDSAESNNAACSDGVDNDGDPYVDCDDYDCSRNPDVTVCEGVEPSGRNSGDSAESNNAACSDGMDNDDDGFIDCDDFDCSRNSEVTVCTE